MIDDYRAILGVAYGAGETEIRAAYRRAAKKAHPDLGGSNEAFRLVRTAADALLEELKDGGPSTAHHPLRDGDHTSLDGHWMSASAELAAIWGMSRDPYMVYAPQKIGLSPFIIGVSLNPAAYHWLTQKIGLRGVSWDFHVADTVGRIFFRRPDDARQFQLRFF